eukprot:TRINITY_DN6880_c0_g1_i1.p1 TRINITY_DN6880_c0_g1~~TRINITY_DN6880_c0_g1_i1.p1  ORF type:complete len:197 (+),score=8.25 TRINITY_DN6880_c0_g1_i1:160-750(+)
MSQTCRKMHRIASNLSHHQSLLLRKIPALYYIIDHNVFWESGFYGPSLLVSIDKHLQNHQPHLSNRNYLELRAKSIDSLEQYRALSYTVTSLIKSNIDNEKLLFGLIYIVRRLCYDSNFFAPEATSDSNSVAIIEKNGIELIFEAVEKYESFRVCDIGFLRFRQLRQSRLDRILLTQIPHNSHRKDQIKSKPTQPN